VLAERVMCYFRSPFAENKRGFVALDQSIGTEIADFVDVQLVSARSVPALPVAGTDVLQHLKVLALL
jgi:hypothetical protein